MKRPMLTPCCSNTTAYTRDSSLREIGFERSWNKATYRCHLPGGLRDDCGSVHSRAACAGVSAATSVSGLQTSAYGHVMCRAIRSQRRETSDMKSTSIWRSLDVLFLLCVLTSAAAAQTPSVDGDDKVARQTLVRHRRLNQPGIDHCNNTASSEAGDDNPDDADVDSNDGGSRRQGNEPYSVVDPTDPDLVVAGWNDYCLTDLGAGWQGFAYSLDSGETWTDSIVPGYPQDTSPEGMASPLFRTHTDAGDPIAAFDSNGNLFVGGIAFNRIKPQNGDVYVATYSTTPHA